jgi:hypothetical protein
LVVSGSLAGMLASPRAARRRAMAGATTASGSPFAGGDAGSPDREPAAAEPPGATAAAGSPPAVGSPARPDVLLSHPPRPRKKKKR